VIGRSGIGRVLAPRLDAGESEMLNKLSRDPKETD
jgi:hypothetical protein